MAARSILGPPGSKPDFSRLERALRRKDDGRALPFFEILVDRPVMEAILEVTLPGDLVDERVDFEGFRHQWDQAIRFWCGMGYDYVPIFARHGIRAEGGCDVRDTAPIGSGERHWRDEHLGMFRTVSDVEAYPWPDPRTVSQAHIEYVSEHLPEGMKIIPVIVGVMEFASDFLGTERLLLGPRDEPDIVQAVSRRVTENAVGIADAIVGMENVGAVIIGDDWGYRQGTLLPPEDVASLLLPCLRGIAQVVRARGLPVIFHSCGNLEEVMPAVIDAGIDAKHSFEDVILPAAEFKRRHGDRIAVLGGVDIDILSRSSEDEVRRYVRGVIESCAPGGGYAFGTGNSVTNYVSVGTYLAMLDEGRRFRGG